MDNNTNKSDNKNLINEDLNNIPTPSIPKEQSGVDITITDNNNNNNSVINSSDLNNQALSHLQNLIDTMEHPVVSENNNTNEVKTPEPDINIEENIPTPNNTQEVKNQLPQSNSEPLQNQAQVIGTLEKDKQKFPVSIVVLFVVLMIFLIFMPNIIDLTNKIFGTNIDSHSGEKLDINPDKKEDNTEVTSTNIAKISSETVLKLNNIEFSNISKATDEIDGVKTNVIKFSVKNTANTLYKFDKKVYLDFYNDSNTFINRLYIETLKEISGGVTNNYSIKISDDINNSATNLNIVLRVDDDYPSVNVSNNQLVCSTSTEAFIYTFNENKLINIKDTYTYTKGSDSLKYNNDLLSYSSRINNLNNQEGVTAVITETDTGFITNIAIDYSTADYSKLSSNTNYYMKDTEAKVISFEMISKGYDCR